MLQKKPWSALSDFIGIAVQDGYYQPQNRADVTFICFIAMYILLSCSSGNSGGGDNA